jgi:hypothetical protein
MQSTATRAEDVAQSQDYAGQMMGIEGGYTDYLGNMLGQLEGGVGGQSGLTDAEKAAYTQQIEGQIRSTREDTMQVIEALGAEGRTGAAYRAMDELSSTIGDLRVQSQVKLLENDMARKQMEYNALAQRYDIISGRGGELATNYQNLLRQNRVDAIQGYASQITVLAQENQQFLDKFSQHANTMYQQIMTEMGYESFLTEQQQAAYDLYMQPYLDALNEWYMRKQVDIAEDANKGFFDKLFGW